jgi:periplasmic protein TonB
LQKQSHKVRLMINAPALDMKLPWSSTHLEDRKYLSILVVCLVLTAVIGVLIPQIDLPKPTREEKAELPPQLAKIILQKKIEKKPKPKPPEPKVEKPKPEENTPKEKKSTEDKPKPVATKNARERAEKVGLAAMQDDLASLRESFDISSVSDVDLNSGNTQVARAATNVIAKKAVGKSAGVSSSQFVTAVQSESSSGKQVARVNIPTASDSMGGDPEAAEAAASSDSVTRTEDSIRSAFQQHQGVLIAIYNRALRKNPLLEGRVVFQIVIQPNGVISSAKILSSSLGDKKLERKLMARLKLINFGAQSVGATTTNWSIDFLPR